MTLAVLGGAAGCATTSADFRLSKVGATEAAIAGRLTVIYNGKIFTENCRATFGDGQLRMSSGGIVLFQVKKGWTALARLDCQNTSNQHIRIRGAHFFARGDGWVSDFGDVVILWDTVGGFKPSSMFGLLGAMVDEASDDGVASVEVKPPAAEVREAFRHQTGIEGRWSVQPLSQPKNSVPQGNAGVTDPAPPTPTAQRGFFCTSAPGTRDHVSVCERDRVACDRALSRLGGTACEAAETAWCFVADARLRCFQTQRTCAAQLENSRAPSDLCGEQY